MIPGAEYYTLLAFIGCKMSRVESRNCGERGLEIDVHSPFSKDTPIYRGAGSEIGKQNEHSVIPSICISPVYPIGSG